MGRPKLFTREEVLSKTIAVFWEKGFSETTVQDLERVTGVNKSGLYAEFKNKEEIFLESLRFYLQTRGGEELLRAEPKGWHNIRRFLEIGHTCYSGRRGCFAVNSLRDVHILPPIAMKIVEASDTRLKQLIKANIQAERPGAKGLPLTGEMILTFFAGLCIEQNAGVPAATAKRKISQFLELLSGVEGSPSDAVPPSSVSQKPGARSVPASRTIGSDRLRAALTT